MKVDLYAERNRKIKSNKCNFFKCHRGVKERKGKCFSLSYGCAKKAVKED